MRHFALLVVILANTVGCVPSGHTVVSAHPTTAPSSLIARCDRIVGDAKIDPLVCGLTLGEPVRLLCSQVRLSPFRMMSPFSQGVRFIFPDSSILIADVALASVDEDESFASDPCHRPIRAISREWQFLARQTAQSVFSSTISILQEVSKSPKDLCVVQGSNPQRRGSAAFFVRDEAQRRQVVVMSLNDAENSVQSSSVRLFVALRDSAERPLSIAQSQKVVPCSELLTWVASRL